MTSVPARTEQGVDPDRAGLHSPKPSISSKYFPDRIRHRQLVVESRPQVVVVFLQNHRFKTSNSHVEVELAALLTTPRGVVKAADIVDDVGDIKEGLFFDFTHQRGVERLARFNVAARQLKNATQEVGSR